MLAIEPLRYTPAGVPCVKLSVKHESWQPEAGSLRQVVCEMSMLAFAEVAVLAAGLNVGQLIKASGFLAQQSYRSRQLILHINDIILE